MASKNIVITGASVGIGAATAHRFAKEGHTLILLARRKEKLEALQNELGSKKTFIYEIDVTDSNAVVSVFKLIEKEFGHIDILVNNAGGAFGLDFAQNADLNDWEKCIDVNIKGLMYCTHAVLPGMVKRNQGHIVNLGSVAGHYPYPGGNVYGGVKAFVHQFSLNLRADLLGTAIRVTCLEPGLVGGTEFSQVRFHGDKEKAQKIYEGTAPLLPEDIAEVIYFSTSLSPHINLNVIELMPVSQAFSSLSVSRCE